MRNLIIGVVVVAAGAFLFASWKIQRDVAKGVDMAIMTMSPFVLVQYDGVSATLTGELTIDGVRARIKGFSDEILIDRIGIDTPSFLSLMKFRDMQKLVTSGEDVLPKYFGIMIEGWRMPVDADYGRTLHAERLKTLAVSDADSPRNECTGKYGLSPEALVAMGYEEYDLSLSAHFRQRDGDYTVEIKTDGVDMYTVDAELVLVGDMLTELAKGSRYRPKMSEMRIEYTDDSMGERITAYCQRRGLSDDEIHLAMIDSFEFMGQQYGVEFDEYVLDPYIEFLSGGRTFVISAKPNEPVSLSQISLYNPKDVPALLQLSAEVR